MHRLVELLSSMQRFCVSYPMPLVALRLLSWVVVLRICSHRVESVHLNNEDGFFLETLNVRRTRQRSSLREQGGGIDSRCKTLRVLLASDDVAVGLIDGFSDFSEIGFGTLQGGKVLLSNPDDETDKIGDYTVHTTFLSAFNFTDSSVDCMGTGAYQFGMGEQIAFTSTCAGLPYFTITGGQGDYLGATGYVEFMIPDPAGRGFFHDLYVCTTTKRNHNHDAPPDDDEGEDVEGDDFPREESGDEEGSNSMLRFHDPDDGNW